MVGSCVLLQRKICNACIQPGRKISNLNPLEWPLRSKT